MRARWLLAAALAAAALAAGCDSAIKATIDAKPIDAVYDAPPKAVPCAATFGDALNASFGRLDGTVLAVVPPGDEQCAEPNSTHLVIQSTIAGVAYRLVVDVLSTNGDPVGLDEVDEPLVGGAWAEGWHTPASLDYTTDLYVHSTSFTAMPQAALVNRITSEITLGAHISVFATSGSTEPDSAHLVHRNTKNADGAIVIGPETDSPHYLLMKFSEDVF